MHAAPAKLDDLAQDVWKELVKRLPDFQHDPSRATFKSWLYMIVQNKVADMARGNSTIARASLAEEIKAQLRQRASDEARRELERRAAHDLVAEALEQLRPRISPQNYRLLEMRWLEGCSIGTIALELHLTRNEVSCRDRRLRRLLRKVLEQNDK